jgi:hypothetical protein
MSTESTAPPDLSAREKELQIRYDRQIRLWGNATQKRLQSTHVHIKFTSTASFHSAAIELLKNLVLGGLGSVSMESATESPTFYSKASKTNDEERRERCNFLLLPGNLPDESKEEQQPAGSSSTCREELAVLRGLKQLNPFVDVQSVGLDRALEKCVSEERSLVMVWAGLSRVELDKEVVSLSQKLAQFGDSTARACCISIHHIGSLSQCLFFLAQADASQHQESSASRKSPRDSNSGPGSFGLAALKAALDNPSYIERQHYYYQLAVLGVHLSAFDFALLTPEAQLQLLNRTSSELRVESGFYLACKGDSGANVDSGTLLKAKAQFCKWVSEGSNFVTSVDTAVAGGILCQQLIAKIGQGVWIQPIASKHEPGTASGPSNAMDWLTISSGVNMECILGSV